MKKYARKIEQLFSRGGVATAAESLPDAVVRAREETQWLQCCIVEAFSGLPVFTKTLKCVAPTLLSCVSSLLISVYTCARFFFIQRCHA